MQRYQGKVSTRERTLGPQGEAQALGWAAHTIYRVLAERNRGALRDRMTGELSDLGSVGAEGELRRGQDTE